MLHEILAIDVWGNARDGYEINDEHGTGVIVEIPASASDSEALKLIRKALGHRADARGYHDPIGSEDGYCFHKNKNGEPAYFTRLVDEGE